jgi:ferredoxin
LACHRQSQKGSRVTDTGPPLAAARLEPRIIDREDFDALIHALQSRGYRVIGPTERGGVVDLAEIGSTGDLPVGIGEDQDGGHYRLRARDDGALFGFASGPASWKRFLHPPSFKLWEARPDRGSWRIEPPTRDERPLAFVGARSCDLHAIRSLDTALLEIEDPDPNYARRRAGTFVVAVNCGTAGGTCFCASTGTGPRAEAGFDLALTELIDGASHRFLAEVGSDRGAEVLAEVPSSTGGPDDVLAADAVVERTRESMGRELDVDGLKDLLDRNLDHPRWDEVSERCLTCGNCTMVCPTCFCTDVEETTDLAGVAERRQRWDSCFTVGFTYVHGGSVRPSPRSRYRQWMTHKLASWDDQFDSAGCVGCGRCITWCPVAIDITKEAAAIRATDGAVS